MALKKQTRASLETINVSIKGFLKWHNKLRDAKTHSDDWFVYLRERNAYYSTLLQVTGLSMSQVNDLIYNKTNTASYWSPDGEIRKDHPH